MPRYLLPRRLEGGVSLFCVERLVSFSKRLTATVVLTHQDGREVAAPTILDQFHEKSRSRFQKWNIASVVRDRQPESRPS